MEAQKQFLRPRRTELEKGRGEKGNYLLDEQHVLWYAPRGAHAVAVPRELISGVLALVHGTYGHPGDSRTTMFIERKCHWPALKKDKWAYALSCKCRRRKRPWGTQIISMMPARLLQPWEQPWEVLEMDLEYMKMTPSSGNRYLPVMMDRGPSL